MSICKRLAVLARRAAHRRKRIRQLRKQESVMQHRPKKRRKDGDDGIRKDPPHPAIF